MAGANVALQMTVLTAGACSLIVNAAGQAVPAAVGAAAGAVITSVKVLVHATPVKVAISTAVGAGTSAGAITGAIMGKTAISAITGALTGGMSAAGVGSVLAGSIAVTTEAIASSPIGLLTVGASHTPGNQIMYDCWKPVVRDISVELSDGMALKDLVCHPNIDTVTVEPSGFMPQITLENVWGETYEIQYVLLHGADNLFCHANPISN